MKALQDQISLITKTIDDSAKKEWKYCSFNYTYAFNPVDYTNMEPAFLYSTRWSYPYNYFYEEITTVLDKAPRHRRLDSLDPDSCLRSLSVNEAPDGKIYLIAHFRAQNETVRNFDEVYLAAVANKVDAIEVLVSVEEYLHEK